MKVFPSKKLMSNADESVLPSKLQMGNASAMLHQPTPLRKASALPLSFHFASATAKRLILLKFYPYVKFQPQKFVVFPNQQNM